MYTRYDNSVNQSEVQEAMNTLRSFGIAKVEIEFSGGNDEGGADGAAYLDAEGNPVTGIASSSAHQDWRSKEWTVSTYNRETNQYDRRPATPDEVSLARLSEVLEAPIYNEWGSFAGEFYVHGTCTWDVATGTHKLSGQQSHEVWEDFEV